MSKKIISVCMATFNGENWIEEQLESILLQLDEKDEVIVVDDASTDDTIQKICAIGDPRIQIFRNKQNVGEIEAFQKALMFASGDFLFLSDQDDIWLPGKVERVMKEFHKNSSVTLVLSDARVVGSNGDLLFESYFNNRGKFIPGMVANIIKSKFLGCAMAFRKEIRDLSLPFPRHIPGHDMWIGLVNEWYGETAFVSEPLICYRRHGNNTSPWKRQGVWKMLVWRWYLCSAFLRHVCSRAFRNFYFK